MTLQFEHQTAKTRVYIHPVANHSIALIDDFEALDGWLDMDNLIDVGSVGPEANVIKQGYVGDPYMHKLTGLIDNGQMSLKLGNNPYSEGQQAFKAAVNNLAKHPFKIVLTDKINATGTATVIYFRGLPSSAKLDMGEADNIVKLEANLEVDGAIFEVPADVVISWSPAGAALTAGEQAEPYTETVAASGGVGTPSYAVKTGDTLPTGLTLNATTGVISGTPSATGVSTFTIVATFNGFGEDEHEYGITVSA